MRLVWILMLSIAAFSFRLKFKTFSRSVALNGIGRVSGTWRKFSLQEEKSGVRINKCLPWMSRRAADECISEGRVTINGRVANIGSRVYEGDVVKFDGQVQGWSAYQNAKEAENNLLSSELLYLKYWKPVGVTCTADKNDKTNIISSGKFDQLPQRIFTVGRLDKDSSGLILLTSDGRVNVAMLDHSNEVEKVYCVEVDNDVSDADLEILRAGVEITYPSPDNPNKMIKEVTSPCKVKRISRGSPMR